MDVREEKIKKITSLYYSRSDVQEAIFSFSKDREISPRHFEAFGKRPDSLQYKGDIFELVRKGATSFHCSIELWKDPLKLSTNLTSEQLNELRKGWDFLIDIDSKYLDYSKILTKQIIKVLNFHGVKNFGLKFSGNKGFHIIIPCKAFPKEINDVKTSDMYPEWARIISKYITEKTKKETTRKINELNYENSKYDSVKYIKREGGSEDIMMKGVGSDKQRSGNFITDVKDNKTISQKFESLQNKEESWNKEALPDIILVSPRHLFRMPYSLHEKTALASVVISLDEIDDFQPKDADPLKVKTREFMPEVEEGEATELLVQALDWNAQEGNILSVSQKTQIREDFKPVKITNISENIFPPTIQTILKGVADGKKRSLFILTNLFRSIGMEKDEVEKQISEWNKKNKPPLKDNYLKAQLLWSYRNKIVPPPNFDKDYYKGIGLTPTEEEMRYKNPVNYMVKKSLSSTASKKFKNKKS
ncbi:hypothetical protein J4407_02960 [Candidatus Pacearchaeota archaeon]|nr:hypothetical protein [Candidatus Pacearchaeota archaeon]